MAETFLHRCMKEENPSKTSINQQISEVGGSITTQGANVLLLKINVHPQALKSRTVCNSVTVFRAKRVVIEHLRPTCTCNLCFYFQTKIIRTSSSLWETGSDYLFLRASAHNSAREFGEIFWHKTTFEKRRNTGCISSFLNGNIGTKEPPKAADAIARCCLREV